MTTATAEPQAAVEEAPRKKRRQSTSHLKHVPEELAVRELVKHEAELYARQLDRSRTPHKDQMETWTRDLLRRLDLPEGYLGFAMVLMGNFFWKEQFLATPFDRRILLLPHCLKHAEGCPAEYDELGLDCESCGACSIGDYRTKAEKLGYKVLVAEGTPIILKLIVSGYIDSILGVACLNVLEKAIDKVIMAGVPAYAVPLHSGDCKNTKFDESWIWEVLESHEPQTAVRTSGFVPIMRESRTMFDKHLTHLLPESRSTGGFAPLGETDRIARDFLAGGGKRSRPFVTLAAYDALRKRGQEPDAPERTDAVRRVALAMEAFHKASLVHDDIEDDDAFRYGEPTLHRHHGVPTAINVGDYLIGMGYRLITGERAELGAETACDIVDRLGQSHLRLCEGQGAELAWRNADDKMLRPVDALKIYALKTSPAFEASLYAGLRLAGDTGKYDEIVGPFARHLGVGFQILNDLKDWAGDGDNKLVRGQDALAMRPTLLLALALDAADPDDASDLTAAAAGERPMELAEIERLYRRLGVFAKAEQLVAKSRQRAEAIADDVKPDALRQLLYFLVDSVLEDDRQTVAAEPVGLPIITV